MTTGRHCDPTIASQDGHRLARIAKRVASRPTLSYIDVFHLLMVMVLAVIPLVLLMQKPDRQGDAAAP